MRSGFALVWLILALGIGILLFLAYLVSKNETFSESTYSSASLLPLITENNEYLTPEVQKQILPLPPTRKVEVVKSNSQKLEINLDSIPTNNISTDISRYFIEKTILSPDESKIVVLTWNGTDDNFIVLEGPTKDLKFQEIGQANVSQGYGVTWSPNSRYITLVSKAANIGPYRVLIWDAETKNLIANKKPTVYLKDSCASLSLYNPRWLKNNKELKVTYEAYYFVGDKNCQPDSSKPTEVGETTINIEG